MYWQAQLSRPLHLQIVVITLLGAHEAVRAARRSRVSYAAALGSLKRQRRHLDVHTYETLRVDWLA